jgi:hydrogenase nickel incorporation protein HypA/HybF
MHELSIAVSLVEIASQEAVRLGSERVVRVSLNVGALSGVFSDALRSAFEVAVSGTMLEGATLEIEEVPVVVFCPTCQSEQELPGLDSFRCPQCGTPTGDVRRGRELEITSLEIQ